MTAGIVIFALCVILIIILDIIIFNKQPGEVGFKAALLWSLFWISLAVIFGTGVFLFKGSKSGIEYFSCYLMEKALSIDNLFVFTIIFKYFNIEEKYHQKMLLIGIIGAVVFRAIFIIAGVALVNKFEWLLYVFGVLLIYTAYKFLKEEEFKPENSLVIKFAEKYLPYKHSDGFFLIENNKFYISKFTVAVITIELSDVFFAIDSIPAAFGITLDEFIIYTSNIMAILGLRALYFLVRGLLVKIKYFDRGLAAILFYIGLKMLLKDLIHIPVHLSLLFIVVAVTATVLISFRY